MGGRTTAMSLPRARTHVPGAEGTRMRTEGGREGGREGGTEGGNDEPIVKREGVSEGGREGTSVEST